jgi:hypothetical protein
MVPEIKFGDIYLFLTMCAHCVMTIFEMCRFSSFRKSKMSCLRDGEVLVLLLTEGIRANPWHFYYSVYMDELTGPYIGDFARTGRGRLG